MIGCNCNSSSCSCSCDITSLPTGADGLNGYNAYTRLTTNFVVPNVGDNTLINVSNSGQYTGDWANTDQIIFIENAGYYKVMSTGTTSLLVQNLGVPGNAAPLTTINNNSGVSPAGPVGLTGATGAAGTNGTNGTNGINGYAVIYAEYYTYTTSIVGSDEVVKFFNIPTSWWATENNFVELTIYGKSQNSGEGYDYIYVQLGSTALIPVLKLSSTNNPNGKIGTVRFKKVAGTNLLNFITYDQPQLGPITISLAPTNITCSLYVNNATTSNSCTIDDITVTVNLAQ